MNKEKLTVFLLFLSVLILVAGCKVTKNLESNEYLLIKNKVKISNRNILAEELEPYIQQKPNTKLFGMFRTNIAFYNMGSKGKDSKFKKWLRTKAGAEPVLLDTSANIVSMKQMTMYLGNKGYFKSTITDTVIIKKKKAIVEYRIQAAQPYVIRSLYYSIADAQLAPYVFKDTVKCLLKRGRNYDAYLLDDERTRITNNLLDDGFFRFSNIYIKYRIDTNFRQHLCDVTLEIINQVIPSFDNFTMVQQIPHKRYFINKIYIYPEYDHLVPYKGGYDTLVRTYKVSGSDTKNTYYFLNRTQFKVKPRIVAQSIFITPGSHYNRKDVNQSYSQLGSLQVFKYINLQFTDVGTGKETLLQKKDIVDCRVELSRAPAQSISASTDGTNSGGAFGVEGTLGYQCRNIFKGAQIFRLNFTGSFQMQATGSASGDAFFNVIQLGINTGLTFPQFLLPIKPERFSKYFKPKTTILIGYNFQHQQHYDRHITNFTFGYAWDQNEKIKHVFNPVELSMVKVFTDAYFDSVMDAEQDERLKNQYTDHMVAGLKYTFTFSNQAINKIKDFFYIRANFETAGNLIYLVDEMSNATKTEEGYYQIFGLPYSQYVRPDVDIRYYNVYPNKFSLVYRFYGGIGVPYLNSTVLPFEKSFFAGGANGMRGWKMYTLGPGSYDNIYDGSTTFNQIGDIQLEGNIEYRFPVYSWIRGAVFCDVGNIWLLQDSPDLPGGKFTFPGFFKEIAVDAGIGIRLDFDFFIIRMDPAIRLYDPSYPIGDRWYFNKMQLKDLVWNFGIGYPF